VGNTATPLLSSFIGYIEGRSVRKIREFETDVLTLGGGLAAANAALGEAIRDELRVAGVAIKGGSDHTVT
jgi:hypothetical protein|tara:strand:+ start:3535 stop:3744 length:210 start_codon:yes stop_codon:yes gene_type:complete